MPRPHNVSAVKRFLGMVGYFRDCIRNMSMRTKFLRSLLQNGIPFVWTEAEFQDLKTALVSPDLMLHQYYSLSNGLWNTLDHTYWVIQLR